MSLNGTSTITQVDDFALIFEKYRGRVLLRKALNLQTEEPSLEWLSPLDRKLDYFAIANYKNKLIFLSGGFGSEYVPLHHYNVYVYNIACDYWVLAPRMNRGRMSHSSCTLGEHVYAFAGENESSIESLHVKAGQRWVLLLEQTQILKRAMSSVAILNDHSIAIYGGSSKNNNTVEDTCHNEGVVFDTTTKTARPILGNPNDVMFTCTSPSHQLSSEVFVTLASY